MYSPQHEKDAIMTLLLQMKTPKICGVQLLIILKLVAAGVRIQAQQSLSTPFPANETLQGMMGDHEWQWYMGCGYWDERMSVLEVLQPVYSLCPHYTQSLLGD
jgi:hypothetical protein